MSADTVEYTWIGVAPLGADGTYVVTEYAPYPIDPTFAAINTLCDLEKVLKDLNYRSPTACYFQVNHVTGSFLHDQQDCVIWSQNLNTGKVFARGRCVADSLPEFLSHHIHESNQWFASLFNYG